MTRNTKWGQEEHLTSVHKPFGQTSLTKKANRDTSTEVQGIQENTWACVLPDHTHNATTNKLGTHPPGNPEICQLNLQISRPWKHNAGPTAATNRTL